MFQTGSRRHYPAKRNAETHNQILRSYAENVLPKIEKIGIRKCNALLGNLEKKKRCSRINKLYNLVKKLYSQPLAQSIACLENCQGCIRAQLQIRYEVLRSLHGLPTRDVSGPPELFRSQMQTHASLNYSITPSQTWRKVHKTRSKGSKD